ncbi:rSAM/selenodomain-associated transferase 2 [Pedobacter sp. UYP30]|uniref:TIGR04283 family arsenosugar biosynthesis glycosyltransferase n=1 Tax=Pedobacter sp. UYP30 TaxID=1756400 RepID=UPI0033907B86
MISVLIPTFNEEDVISWTIKCLLALDTQKFIKEIIVADGGSTDATCAKAIGAGALVLKCPKKGRAAQMNFAAKNATQEILYFIHADTQPPLGFTEDILRAVHSGFDAGSYRLKFDCDHWFLSLNAWFTRFNVDAVRFGDQSLFVTKSAFEKSDGFLESLVVMEDQHIIKELKKLVKFKLFDKAVVTSSRKYLENGVYKTQAVFFLIFFMYKLGYSQKTLVKTYRGLLKQNKV